MLGHSPRYLPVYSATPLADPAFSAPMQVSFGPPSSAAFSAGTFASAGPQRPSTTHHATSRLVLIGIPLQMSETSYPPGAPRPRPNALAIRVQQGRRRLRFLGKLGL